MHMHMYDPKHNVLKTTPADLEPVNNMASQVAVVTGANKGIGLAIVRALCRHFGEDGVVYLTARDEGRGKAAVELLQKEGLGPKFHPLDVTDPSTVDKFQTHLEKEHGRLDVLINNAGIHGNGIVSTENKPLYEHAVRVMDANFFGLRNVCQSLFPLVRPRGRIVNLASCAAPHIFRNECNDDVREKFRRAKSEQDVVDLMNEFLEDFKAGKPMQNPWPDVTYGMSKLGVVLLSKMQAEMMARDESKEDILVNACCPGFIRTDMSAHFPDYHFGGYKLTPDEGADTPVFLALLPRDTKEPNGQFLLRRKVYDFINTDVNVFVCEPTENV